MPTDVLLIDDSLTDLRLLMDMMSSRRLRVSVALEGERGYWFAVTQCPGLILLDVRMPNLDGFATCRLLKANPKTRSIPVIFLTAADDLDERLKGFALGAVDYVGKPFHVDEVMARVGVHLNLVQKSQDTPEDEGEAAAAGSREAVLARAARNLLRETIADPPSLDELARRVGTNRRDVNRIFQTHHGMPVFAWLREERLRLAHQMVCSTDMPLTMISEQLGYSSSANFARAFRERFGFPPRDLRRGVADARRDSVVTEA